MTGCLIHIEIIQFLQRKLNNAMISIKKFRKIIEIFSKIKHRHTRKTLRNHLKINKRAQTLI